MLASSYYWAYALPWGAPSITSLRLSTANSFLIHLPVFMLTLCLTWTCIGLVCVLPQSLWVRMCCVWNTLFPWSHPSPMPLRIFPDPLPSSSLSFKGREFIATYWTQLLCWVIHGSVGVPVCHYLWVYQYVIICGCTSMPGWLPISLPQRGLMGARRFVDYTRHLLGPSLVMCHQLPSGTSGPRCSKIRLWGPFTLFVHCHP